MQIEEEIRGIESDHQSGATALVLRGIEILRTVHGDPGRLRDAAWRLCLAQPSMAGFRTAVAAALAGEESGRALEALAERIRRAPAAIARFAVPLIRLRLSHSRPLHVVTCSRSALVERTLKAIQEQERVQVSCAESRPLQEGMGLADALTAAGLKVELFSDAAIGTALPEADALVLGADALTSAGFINKVGSAPLAALARVHGVPVYVLAGREKILPPTVFPTLEFSGGPPAEIAEFSGFSVKNPYFEFVPAVLTGTVVTEAGAVELDQAVPLEVWTASATEQYMSLYDSYNMLDRR